MNCITLRRPDDFHLHLRDGAALARTVTDAARQVARAMIMPNLTPALDTLSAVMAYRQRILAHIPEHVDFTPLMTLYLTDALTPETIQQAREAGVIAVKWYPKGATTNSAQGIDNRKTLYTIAEALEKAQMPLLIHGEVTDSDIDIFDREAVFIERLLMPLRKDFPALKITLEHITTANAVQYVESCHSHTAATITAHHLLFNRNAMLVGGIRPHYYCLPILKSEENRQALLKAATSGDARFFMGTDSAPHATAQKESACGCAGCYTGFATLSYYAAAFEQAQALEKLEDFCSSFGARFYDLPLNSGQIVLEKQPLVLPDALDYAQTTLTPFLSGSSLDWRIKGAVYQ